MNIYNGIKNFGILIIILIIFLYKIRTSQQNKRLQTAQQRTTFCNQENSGSFDTTSGLGTTRQFTAIKKVMTEKYIAYQFWFSYAEFTTSNICDNHITQNSSQSGQVCSPTNYFDHNHML